jgi:hypothetical protein
MSRELLLFPAHHGPRGKDLTIPNAGNIHFGSAERLPAASICNATPTSTLHPAPPTLHSVFYALNPKTISKRARV